MLIKGLYSFDKGTCVYQKNTIGHNDISLISKNNKSFFLRLTVKQNLDFFYYTCLNKNRISIFELNRLIREFNVEELLEKEFNELSSGQSQKISIIRALIKNPKLLLLMNVLVH